jgi:hypothetical protein
MKQTRYDLRYFSGRTLAFPKIGNAAYITFLCLAEKMLFIHQSVVGEESRFHSSSGQSALSPDFVNHRGTWP